LENAAFIYWQCLKGDMMLTLSNEQIDMNESQPNLRCLVCYVAETPEPGASHYHEHASYLNSGKPMQHHVIMKNRKYATSSDTFYVGCNTGDFLTFCLEIQRSTGKVILSHAGPNSIYNREVITHTFNKSDLDLAALEFIHVSAGARTVPVRNVTIHFDKQSDLHPTFDKEFNKGAISSDDALKSTDLIIPTKKISVDGRGSSLIPCPDNVNCLHQLASETATHNSKYSHPCRFSELCRNLEPHLTHEPHQVPMCKTDKNCNKLADPIHRAKYRHRDLPDFLVPCRFKQECRDRSDKHRIKYSHGEQVFDIVSKTLSDGKGEIIVIIITYEFCFDRINRFVFRL
jgi:hypothetical protein